MKHRLPNLSYDYIRGIVTSGKGSFTFTTTVYGRRKKHIPAFQLRMSVQNKKLLEQIKDRLKLKNNIYTYQYAGKDGYTRNPFVMLIVRDFGSLKNIIIPLFYNQLIGYKGQQLNEWLEKIGSDPTIPESYKLLDRLHRSGYFEKELRRGGLFEKFIN